MSTLKMPFGKHKGMPIEDVPADYLLWLHENLDLKEGQLTDYISKNIDLIRLAAEDIKNKKRK